MEKDYFKELYECKKQLLNELMILEKIKRAMSYSILVSDIEMEWGNRIQRLKEELIDMEVDLEEIEKEEQKRITKESKR